MNELPELNLYSERRWFKNTYCIGRLSVEGMDFSDVLEDKDRDLTSDMSTADIYKKKVYGGTAIPYGRYEIRLTYSPKFASKEWGKKYGGLVPELIDVPGFVGIRIHPGSNSNQTSGCLLVGENKIVGGLVNSQVTYSDLMDYYLLPAHNAGQKIFITICCVNR